MKSKIKVIPAHPGLNIVVNTDSESHPELSCQPVVAFVLEAHWNDEDECWDFNPWMTPLASIGEPYPFCYPHEHDEDGYCRELSALRARVASE